MAAGPQRAPFHGIAARTRRRVCTGSVTSGLVKLLLPLGPKSAVSIRRKQYLVDASKLRTGGTKALVAPRERSLQWYLPVSAHLHRRAIVITVQAPDLVAILGEDLLASLHMGLAARAPPKAVLRLGAHYPAERCTYDHTVQAPYK